MNQFLNVSLVTQKTWMTHWFYAALYVNYVAFMHSIDLTCCQLNSVTHPTLCNTMKVRFVISVECTQCDQCSPCLVWALFMPDSCRWKWDPGHVGWSRRGGQVVLVGASSNPYALLLSQWLTKKMGKPKESTTKWTNNRWDTHPTCMNSLTFKPPSSSLYHQCIDLL